MFIDQFSSLLLFISCWPKRIKNFPCWDRNIQISGNGNWGKLLKLHFIEIYTYYISNINIMMTYLATNASVVLRYLFTLSTPAMNLPAPKQHLNFYRVIYGVFRSLPSLFLISTQMQFERLPLFTNVTILYVFTSFSFISKRLF
mgnify:CR=1 FL=1